MQTFRSWWRDECGLVLSAELVIILTIVVLGLIVGLTCVQQAVVGELQDIGAAFRGLNQSYAFTGFRGCPKIWGRTSWTAGSAFYDRSNGFVNQHNSIEIGTGCVDCRTEVAPQTAPVAPRVETAVPCPHGVPCPDTSVPVVPKECQACQPLPGQAVPVPMPEIPQGPAPQNLPQL